MPTLECAPVVWVTLVVTSPNNHVHHCSVRGPRWIVYWYVTMHCIINKIVCGLMEVLQVDDVIDPFVVGVFELVSIMLTCSRKAWTADFLVMIFH